MTGWSKIKIPFHCGNFALFSFIFLLYLPSILLFSILLAAVIINSIAAYKIISIPKRSLTEKDKCSLGPQGYNIKLLSVEQISPTYLALFYLFSCIDLQMFHCFTVFLFCVIPNLVLIFTCRSLNKKFLSTHDKKDRQYGYALKPRKRNVHTRKILMRRQTMESGHCPSFTKLLYCVLHFIITLHI